MRSKTATNPAFIMLCAVAAVVMAAAPFVMAAGKNVDLDGNAGNGDESRVNLRILQTFPPKVVNKVKNKAVGDAFTFSWFSAGPGGFTTETPVGTPTGVGAKWKWESFQRVYAIRGNTCGGDICFTQTAGSNVGGNLGPYQVPGRSLSGADVTLSAATLNFSLVTFFSPDQVLFEASSSVAPLGAGLFGYTNTLTNLTSQPITVETGPGQQQGCCDQPNQLICDGACVSYLTDAANCGDCGITCAPGEICSDGVCLSSCPAGWVFCGDDCVDLASDVDHCGECGETCRYICDDGFTPFCDQGTCGCAPNTPGTAAVALAAQEAPVCPPPVVVEVPPNSTVSDCIISPFPATEAPGGLSVCGDEIPDGEELCSNGDEASRGTFINLVPNPAKPIGDAMVTPYAVDVLDGSGDGLIQPGENVDVKIALLNAGSKTVEMTSAVLTSPPVDLTADGINNPVGAAISSDTSAYPDVPGLPPGTSDCNQPLPLSPSRNITPFSLNLPPDHPVDVSRPFNLKVTGTVDGGPFSMDVPLTMGVAGFCDPSDDDGEQFDTVKGLLNPMARLVPEGTSPIPFPDKRFRQGNSRPLKLRLRCGEKVLRGGDILAPEIVGLDHETLGPIDISVIRLNDGANPNDPFFRFNKKTRQWHFKLGTKDLARGKYVLTIRIGGVKDYVTGFALK